MAGRQLWTQIHGRGDQRTAVSGRHGAAALFLGAVDWDFQHSLLHRRPLSNMERAPVRDRNERKNDPARALGRTRSERTGADAERDAAGIPGYPPRPGWVDLPGYAPGCGAHSQVWHGSPCRTCELTFKKSDQCLILNSQFLSDKNW